MNTGGRDRLCHDHPSLGLLGHGHLNRDQNIRVIDLRIVLKTTEKNLEVGDLNIQGTETACRLNPPILETQPTIIRTNTPVAPDLNLLIANRHQDIVKLLQNPLIEVSLLREKDTTDRDRSLRIANIAITMSQPNIILCHANVTMLKDSLIRNHREALKIERLVRKIDVIIHLLLLVASKKSHAAAKENTKGRLKITGKYITVKPNSKAFYLV